MTWLGPAALCLVALAACSPPVPIPRPEGTEVASASQADAAAQRAFLETPLAAGALAVEAVEGGRLLSWDLGPCRDGGPVCGGNGRGPAGQLRATSDFVVVTGVHGRTFWLSWGGDGYVGRDGRIVPLAWDARINGTGTGNVPTLESAAPHS